MRAWLPSAEDQADLYLETEELPPSLSRQRGVDLQLVPPLWHRVDLQLVRPMGQQTDLVSPIGHQGHIFCFPVKHSAM